jgi:hypothetical protein
MELTEYQTSSLCKLEKSILNGQWNNESLIQLIELAGEYLNLQTISKYAKNHNLSYNGVKHNRHIRNIFNVKFVIDNY